MFQFAVFTLAPRPPPPPPAPPPPCGGAVAVRVPTGRSDSVSPVNRLRRSALPCVWLYMTSGSSGSIRACIPSPPPVLIQSLPRIPTLNGERVGPACDPLSCAPPLTL